MNDTEDFVNKLDDVVDMPFGYGVQVSMSKARNQQVLFSGAVKGAPTIFDLSGGFWTIGNCAAKELKLANLITNCDESGETEDGWIELVDAIVELSQTGSFVRKIVYCPEWYAEGETYTKGWYDVNDTEDFEKELGNDITFAPGSGFQVSISKNRNQKITIKSALATDAE